MIRGDWHVDEKDDMRLRDIPSTRENLDLLLRKRAFAKRMPAAMKLGLDYKCAHIIKDLETNSQFFDTAEEKMKETWKTFKHEITNKSH